MFRKGQTATALLFLAPFLITILVFFFYAFARAIYYSFTDFNLFNNARVIGLNQAPRLNANFGLTDAISGANVCYWRQTGMIVVESPGFARTFRMPDPRRAARALLELAAGKRPPVAVGPFQRDRSRPRSTTRGRPP